MVLPNFNPVQRASRTQDDASSFYIAVSFIAVSLALSYKIVYYLTKIVKSSIMIEAINLSIYIR